MKIDVLGVEFDNLTMDEAVTKATALMDGAGVGYVVTPNPEILWMCRKDPALYAAVSEADLVLADGIGVLYGARILKRPLKEKLSGIDFAAALFKTMAVSGKRVYLLGAKPGVAEMAGRTLEKEYPGLEVCGASDGYFQDDAPVIEEINRLQPDFLAVCLGAPKQELWMRKNRGELQVGLMAGLGGSLDVFAGKVARAPKEWRKLGLEWLYRLVKEPRRIKRMIKLPAFLVAVVMQRLNAR